MTRDELIEKVAREISTASFVRFTPGTYAIAEAAIDIVLEEAAKVANEAAEQCTVTFYASAVRARSANEASLKIAAAIRALKSGDGE